MASAPETAYPRLRSNLTPVELKAQFDPTAEEKAFVLKNARQPTGQMALLLLLKTFQRLGYFPGMNEIPPNLAVHLMETLGLESLPAGLFHYDESGARLRHTTLVREYLGVTAYGDAARACIENAAAAAATVRDDLPDLINICIEELTKNRFELPAFSTLHRIAQHARAEANRRYFDQIAGRLTAEDKDHLARLLTRPAGESDSLWAKLKSEAGRPTVRQVQHSLNHLAWLRSFSVRHDVFAGVPAAKRDRFATEARSLDLTSMNDLAVQKRLALTVALLHQQTARSLDELASMFIKQVRKIHKKAKDELLVHRAQHAERADSLVEQFHHTATLYKENPDAVAGYIRPRLDRILQDCEAHRAVAGDNHLPFLARFLRTQRSGLLLFLEKVPLEPASQDRALLDAVAFAVRHKESGEWVTLAEHENFMLGFVSERWWPLVTGQHTRQTVRQIHHRHFEICVLTQTMNELRSGDLFIPDSDEFSDYRTEQIPWEEFDREVAQYCREVGLPETADGLVAHLKDMLSSAAKQADEAFPGNESLRIEDGQPVLKQVRRQRDPQEVKKVARRIQQFIPRINIIDALVDTEHWLNWSRHFGPVSKLESKLEQPRERYIATVFCYGCNLGPTQTARCLKGLDRKQISFVNQRHITEQNLDDAITGVVNAYAGLELQQCWGLGESASADGTKWDLYERNLLSEYHVRYGGYGGIGYYHVADSYIALFSRFIPCGVWEAVHILDGLVLNKSQVQPDAVHADTQGQSTPVFGLAHLLGIKLMPRIRNWKDLRLYRPGQAAHYQHIDSLFQSGGVDWELIRAHYRDLLRVAVSIKLGRIASSTILRRFGSENRKNKVYFAMRELGRVVRTAFLLDYITRIDLRRKILTATNKSEAFNRFVQWAFFGGDSVIAENLRGEQRKIIKYNHLVANLVILHTAVLMTQALDKLATGGAAVAADDLRALSPYQVEHINRFGSYKLRFDRQPAPMMTTLKVA
ncbi:MAG: Tn3 family transposase [Acidobacteria bacterium]|nr:Tn3 family transposase [Acidobacteriota bacterium]